MRKKIVLIIVIAVSIFLGIFCYKTWFVAFAATRYVSRRTDGKQGIVGTMIIPSGGTINSTSTAGFLP